MRRKAFNLLHEPWIKVFGSNDQVEEVSILECFSGAQNYLGLAGELPTQDAAILRVLLAIIHRVFERVDLAGSPSPIQSPMMALDRFQSLWDEERFPMKPIENYLGQFEERFYLFHEEYPFFQVPSMGKSTPYTASKLNGELSESGNKVRLFSQRAGEKKSALEYSEACRWLIHVNAYDDNAAKSSKKLASAGLGWLGRLSLVTAVGTNLFETLLLNCVFLRDGGNELWVRERSVWELPDVKSEERTPIKMPEHPASLYTLQSRRLLLVEKNGKVVGYKLLGGDFFPEANSFTEQMTLWMKKESDHLEYVPRLYDPNRQLWREFPALVALDTDLRRPGVVGWLGRLKEDRRLERSHFRFQVIGVTYDAKKCSMQDLFCHSIRFSSDLLTNLGQDWVSRITEEIAIADKLADQVGQLAQDLALATGITKGLAAEKRKKDPAFIAAKAQAKEQAFFRIDEPFRIWLESIAPTSNAHSKDALCKRWRLQARDIVRQLGGELFSQAGPQAFAGNYVSLSKDSEAKKLFTAPGAYNWFLARTSI